MNVTCPGIIIEKSVRKKRAFRPAKSRRARAYPAIDAMKSVVTTRIPLRRNEFLIHTRNRLLPVARL